MGEGCPLVLQNLMFTLFCRAGCCRGAGPKAVRGHRGAEMSRKQVSLLDEFFLGKGGKEGMGHGRAVSHSSQLGVQWGLTKAP